MKKTIRLGKGLDIPLDITTQKIAIMGGNGSGKTYLGSKIEEEILKAEGWVIIFDPVGIHWGLRLSSDGVSPSGLEIPVFGGLHGDILLTPESGAIIADLLVDRRLSAVLDVSQFSDSELNRFATEFGNQFWSRMKAKRQAVLLVFEECQEFIPQNPAKGEEKKLHIYTRIAKLGRNYGIGVMLISQRPQDINKKVFNLTQLMFAFQMTGTHERKSMEEWISYIGLDQKFSNILPTLEIGEPFVASPRWLKIAAPYRIDKKNTYDSSSTPDFDEDAETIHLEPIDIATLETRLKSLIQEAKDNDPAELKKELSRLRRELEKKPAPIVAQEPKIERVEVPIVTDDQLSRLWEGLKEVNSIYSDLRDVEANIKSLMDGKLDELYKTVETLAQAFETAKKPIAAPLALPVKRDPLPRIEPKGKTVSEPGDSSLSRSMQRIVNSLAWMETIGVNRPPRAAIAFLSGQSTAPESYKKNLSSLSKAGLVSYPDSGSVSLTDEGRAIADYQERPGSPEELQAEVLSKLPGAQARILEVLIEQYPDPIDRDELADRAGFASAPESFKKNVSALRNLRVIDYPSSSSAVALPVLFLEAE